MTVYDDIQQEREYQDHKWGGSEHDDNHISDEWVAFMVRQLGRASYAAEAKNATDYRKALVRTAALSVAAIEAFDRYIEEFVPNELIQSWH